MNLIPQYLVNRITEQQKSWQLEAYVLMLDISGSVALCEQLMQYGKEGLEKLSVVMNSLFAPSIQAVYSSGGFVSSFAGDSITAVFPAENSSPQKIISCVGHITSSLKNLSFTDKMYDQNRISIKVGIALGTLNLQILQSGRSGHSFLFSGPAAKSVATALNLAVKDEIVVDQHLALKLPSASLRSCGRNQMFYLQQLKASPSNRHADQTYDFDVPDEIQCDFINADLITKHITDEFKNAASVFISLQDCPGQNENISVILSLAHKYRGYINSVEYGDKGVICLIQFGVPFIAENYLQHALLFILEVRKKLHLNIRAGLTEGRVFAGFIGSHTRSVYTCVGSSVNLAARIVMQADWGQLLISESVYNKTKTDFSYKSGQSYKLKGIKDRQLIFELKYEISSNQKKTASVFIGREKSLVKLQSFLNQLVQESRAGIFYLIGRAGIGKTRLLQEFAGRQSDRAGIIFHSCSSAVSEDYTVFKKFIESKLNSAGETAAGSRRHFEQHYRKYCRQLANQNLSTLQSERLVKIKPLIGYLLGIKTYSGYLELLPPGERNIALLLAVRDFVSISLCSTSQILIVDNYQWLDEDSKRVFTALSKLNSAGALLIVFAGRPADDGFFAKINTDSNFFTAEEELQSLGSKDSLKLAANLLDTRLSQAAVLRIIEVTAGNPLYISQYCQMYNSGVFGLDSSDIPMAVENILSARLDRLPELLVAVVKLAAVIGAEFDPELLYDLCRKKISSGRLSRELFFNTLKLGIYEKIWQTDCNGRYSFEQLLFQEAAYQRQLSSELKDCHLLIAESMISLEHQDANLSAQIGHHYFQAAVWENAVCYYQKSADLAVSSYLPQLAISGYTKIEQTVLKMTDPDFHQAASAIYRRGMVYEQNLAEYDRAESVYRQALDYLTEKSVSDQILLADIYNNLGKVYQYSAKLDKALEYYNLCRQLRTDYLGTNHPETARILNNLGIIYFHKGDQEAALRYYTEAMTILYNTPEESNYLLIATTSLNLGNLYLKVKPDQALSYYIRARELYKTYLPAGHHNIAAVANNLGEYYKNAGDFMEAEKYHQEALQIRKKIYGTYHPLTAASLGNLSEVSRVQGDYDQALVLQKQSVAIKEKILGIEHLATAVGYNNIGLLYKLKGKNSIALRYLNRAYNIWHKTLGENHPNIAMVLTNIGDISKSCGDLKGALAKFEQALLILSRIYPQGHSSMINILLNSSEVYSSREDYAQALNCLNKADGIIEKLQLRNKIINYTVMNNLSTIYRQLNLLEKALGIAETCKTKFEALLGKNHPETGLVYTNLGAIYLELNDYQQSRFYFESAINIFKDEFRSYGCTAETYLGYGQLLARTGQSGEAESAFRNAREIFMNLQSEDKSGLVNSRLAYLKSLGVE